MSDLGTSNAVRGCKTASQDKMKIESVVSCDKIFRLGYRLRGFWEVADIWIHSNGRSELVRFKRLYRFFIQFTYPWVNWHKSWKRCWAYHGIPYPNMSTISMMSNLLLFESSQSKKYSAMKSEDQVVSTYLSMLNCWSNH